MLPFTVRILANVLLDEILFAPTGTLIVVHDGDVPRDPTRRAMTVHRTPIGDPGQWRSGVPGMLTDLHQAIITPPTPHPELREVVDALASPMPGMRLTAVGVHYDDVDPSIVEHLDAVDIDGRLYRLSRVSEGVPFVAIDHSPDPGAVPATQPGLAAVLAAAS